MESDIKNHPKSLFSLLKLKPNDIYALNYQNISEGTNEHGLKSFLSKATLEPVELEIFDTIDVLYWIQERDLSDKPFNLILKRNDKQITVEQMRYVTNLLVTVFGPDFSYERDWSDYDSYTVRNQIWRGRWWNFDPTGKSAGNLLVGWSGFEVMLCSDLINGFSIKVIGAEQLIKLAI